MRLLRVVTGVVVAGALAAAAFVFIRSAAAGDAPARERLVVSPTVVRPNVLVDAAGTVIEEFSGDCADRRHAALCERVKDQLGKEGLLDRVKTGGLTIKTAIDPHLQQAAQQAVDRWVDRDDTPLAAQAMIVPGTGAIRALATSRPADEVLSFQQGTTAMVYALAAALQSGIRYEDGFPYSPEYRAPSFNAFKNCKGNSVAEPAFTVVNRKRDHGAFTTLQSGTWAAEETFFLKLTEKVGLCPTVTMAKRLGLARADRLRVLEYETFVLGVNEVDPVVVATTYATLAARGKHCEPMAVTEVSDGPKVLRAFAPRCDQVLDPPVADAVTGVLAGALERSRLKGIGRDAAGMEGTTDDYVAAWYAGYTPDLASAVAVGVPGRGALENKLSDVTVGGRRYEHVDGASIPGSIWKDSMKAALSGVQETTFEKPDTGRFGGCRDHCAE